MNNVPQSNYMDQALSFEMVRNLCNGKGNAWSELGKFVLIIGMDQFKTLFKAIVDRAVKSIGEFDLSQCKNPFTWCYQLVADLFHTLKNKISIVRVDTPYTFELNPEYKAGTSIINTDAAFQLSFYEFVVQDSFKNNIWYEVKETKDVCQKDNNTLQYTEVWKNMSIHIPNTNTKMVFRDDLTLQFKTQNNKKSLVSINSLKTQYVTYDIDIESCICDYLLKSKDKLILDFSIFCTDDVIKATYKDLSNWVFSNIHSIENLIKELPCGIVISEANYIEFNSKRFYYERRIFSNVMSNILLLFMIWEGEKSCTSVRAMKRVKITRFQSSQKFGYLLHGFPYDSDPKVWFQLDEQDKKQVVLLLTSCIEAIPILQDKDCYQQFINWICALNGYPPLFSTEEDADKVANGKNNKMQVLLLSPSESNPQQDLFTFITSTSIQKHSNTCKDKIETFDIKMEYTEEEHKTPNPQYEIYQKRLDELKQLGKNETADKLIGKQQLFLKLWISTITLLLT